MIRFQCLKIINRNLIVHGFLYFRFGVKPWAVHKLLQSALHYKNMQKHRAIKLVLHAFNHSLSSVCVCKLEKQPLLKTFPLTNCKQWGPHVHKSSFKRADRPRHTVCVFIHLHLLAHDGSCFLQEKGNKRYCKKIRTQTSRPRAHKLLLKGAFMGIL